MARTAVGIPDRDVYGEITDLRPGLAEYVVQLHKARRAGKHFDVRVGAPWGQLFSWATKHLPGPGEKRMAWQQPLHEGQYADFEGRIGSGQYGSGTVRKHDRGKVLITDVKPGKISFVVAHKRFPEHFTLVRNEKSPNRGWLMMNTTPTKPVKDQKPRYVKVPSEDVEKLFSEEYLASEKIDGASALIQLLGDKVNVLSYRTSTSGRPIEHTQRLSEGAIRAEIPKELQGKVLRGELYGERKGEAIPPQELGGLLNATLAETIKRKKERDTALRVALFDVQGEEDKPYGERLETLRKAMRVLPKQFFHLPRMATTPEEMRQLWLDVKEGRNPRTREGLVFQPVKGGKPIKVKLRPENKVVVRRVFPGGGKLRGSGAGGFEYSLTPEGPIVGRVGTGFSEEARRHMLEDPGSWEGRIARISAQERFPSGAYRAPSFIALHEDYDDMPKTASCGKQASIALDINKGDVLLGGRFKNVPMTVEEIGVDELGQPTVNGRKLLAYRIKKLMKEGAATTTAIIGRTLAKKTPPRLSQLLDEYLTATSVGQRRGLRHSVNLPLAERIAKRQAAGGSVLPRTAWNAQRILRWGQTPAEGGQAILPFTAAPKWVRKPYFEEFARGVDPDDAATGVPLGIRGRERLLRRLREWGPETVERVQRLQDFMLAHPRARPSGLSTFRRIIEEGRQAQQQAAEQARQAKTTFRADRARSRAERLATEQELTARILAALGVGSAAAGGASALRRDVGIAQAKP